MKELKELLESHHCTDLEHLQSEIEKLLNSEYQRGIQEGIEEIGENCTNCNNIGMIRTYAEVEQCQFCYENPNSKFNLYSKLQSKLKERS